MTQPTLMLSKENIKKAVQCPNWRKVRDEWLKGQKTSNQIATLKVYLSSKNYGSPDGKKCCDDRTRWIQVYNYLNSLARKRRIDPVFSRDLEDNKVKVIKE